MQIITKFEQGSDEWFEWRMGKIGGSSASVLVGYKERLKDELIEYAKSEGIELPVKITKDRKTGMEKETVTVTVDVLKDIICSAKPDFNTRKMVLKANEDFEYRMLAYELSDGTAPEEDPRDRGHRLEPEAREEFMKESGLKVREVGGAYREDEPRITVSPDGLIEDEKNEGIFVGGWEGKALAGWKHIKIWQKDEVPEDYMEQCLQYFVVNEDCKTVYFSSYCPEITMHPLHTIELHREDYGYEIAVMEEGQKQFFKEHDERINKIYFKK